MNSEKFLKFILSFQGSRLDYDTLENWQNYRSSGGHLKQKKKKKKGVRTSGNLPEQPIVNWLLQAGLLQEVPGNAVLVKKPFEVEGSVSMNPTGLVFINGSFNGNILIPPGGRAGARHRDTVKVAVTGFSDNGAYGRIREITSRFSTRFIGRMVGDSGQNTVFALIDTPDKQHVLVPGRGKYPKSAFVQLEITGETRKGFLPGQKDRYPVEMSVCRVISPFSNEDEKSDLQRVAIRYGLPVEYRKELIPAKKEAAKKQKEGEKDKRRRNLIKLNTYTIDGEDAKDFDDAISFARENGKPVLYVHIADVAHFVEKGSPLDKEALERGNSYYLRTSVLPMLPFVLSEDFCSLRPKTRRLALSCRMEFNPDLTIGSYSFFNSLIYINKRYTYNLAEKEIHNERSPVGETWKFMRQVMEARKKAGRIDLELEETTISLEDGKAQGILYRERLDAHRLIEECMISANICAARFARERNIHSMQRIHESVPAVNLERLNSFLVLFVGASKKDLLRDLSHAEVQRAINLMAGHESEKVFHYLLLRSFSQAYYGPDLGGHWGLALEDYSHFTSPIRRYADLIVHRIIKASLAGEKIPYDEASLKDIGVKISARERIAMEGERMMHTLLAIRFLSDRTGAEFDGFFSGFNSKGLFFRLDEPPVEGFVPARDFSSDGQIKNLDPFRVVLPKFQQTASLGSRMKLKLEKCDWENVQLQFSIVSPKPDKNRKNLPERSQR